jgi:hypothetical protein
MRLFISILLFAAASLTARAQQDSLPDRLGIAMKEGLTRIEEQKQQDIVTYAKNNKPADDGVMSAPTNGGNFYTLYVKDEDNRYYNNYRDTNIDPIITTMPAPGPNLNYFMVDPCNGGNYDRVVN